MEPLPAVIVPPVAMTTGPVTYPAPARVPAGVVVPPVNSVTTVVPVPRAELPEDELATTVAGDDGAAAGVGVGAAEDDLAGQVRGPTAVPP